MTSEESQLNGVSDIFHGVVADIVDSEHKASLFTTTAMALGTVGIGSAKIPMVTAPALAVEALQYSESSLVTGVVTGAVFGLWNYASTGITNAAGKHFPNAKARASAHYADEVTLLAHSLPGFEINPPDEEPRKSRALRIGNTVLTHFERGVAAVGVGTTPYIVAAQLQEKPEVEVRQLRRRLALDAALLVGSISCATAGVVAEIGDSHPELAHQIQNGATDSKVLMGGAIGLVIFQAVKDRWRTKRKAAAQAQPAL